MLIYQYSTYTNPQKLNTVAYDSCLHLYTVTVFHQHAHTVLVFHYYVSLFFSLFLFSFFLFFTIIPFTQFSSYYHTVYLSFSIENLQFFSQELVVSFLKGSQIILTQDGNLPKFVQIASLHSELVAISSEGKLYQWRWKDITPYSGDPALSGSAHHPRSRVLGLMEEKVVAVSACSVRASVLTASGKVFK